MKEDKEDLKFDFEEYGNHITDFLISISETFEDESLKSKAIDFSQNLSVSIDRMLQESTKEELRAKTIDAERETRYFFRKAKKLFKSFSWRAPSSNGYYIAKSLEAKYNKKKTKRTAGYCLNIFWSLLALIFINFYRDFIAYFQIVRADGVLSIRHFSLVTGDFNHIVLLLSTVFVITIALNIILLSYDRYKVNRIMHVITNVFFILAIMNIIHFFPFELSILPYGFIVPYLEDILKIMLAAAAFVMGIQIIVNFVKITKKTKISEELF